MSTCLFLTTSDDDECHKQPTKYRTSGRTYMLLKSNMYWNKSNGEGRGWSSVGTEM